MNKLNFFLLSSPATAVVLLLNPLSNTSVMAAPSTGIEIVPKTDNAHPVNLDCSRQDCTGNNHLERFQDFPNVQKDDNGTLLLQVTEEESDTAVAMFGCDCPKAINALRQIRGIPVGVEGDKILPGPTILPCTQREI